MSTTNFGDNGAVPAIAAGWYPTAVRGTMRWWDGSAWTGHLVVNSTPMTVITYRQRMRAMVIIWIALAAVFLLTIAIMAIIFRSSAVLWAAVPSCLVVIVLSAIAGTVGARRLKLITESN